MAALMKPEGSGGQSPASEKSPPEAKGKRLHAGLVERETVVVGMVRYAKRFAVLYSDPLLAFFTDGSGSVLKNSRSLAGCALHTLLLRRLLAFAGFIWLLRLL